MKSTKTLLFLNGFSDSKLKISWFEEWVSSCITKLFDSLQELRVTFRKMRRKAVTQLIIIQLVHFSKLVSQLFDEDDARKKNMNVYGKSRIT